MLLGELIVVIHKADSTPQANDVSHDYITIAKALNFIALCKQSHPEVVPTCSCVKVDQVASNHVGEEILNKAVKEEAEGWKSLIVKLHVGAFNRSRPQAS